MALSFSSVTICGNLTRDPEMKYTASGLGIANVAVAVNDRKKQGDEWVDDTSYFDIVVFGKQGEVISSSCKKGDSITVIGRLKQETWERDGQKRSAVRIIADKASFSGSPSGNGRPQQQQSRQSSGGGQSRSSNYSRETEDVPF